MNFIAYIYFKPMMQIVVGVMGSKDPHAMTLTSSFCNEWHKYTGMVKSTMYILYHFRIIKGFYAIFAMIWILAD